MPRKLASMPSFLFWNAQGSFFHNLAPWNRSLKGGIRLLRNDIPQGNWVEVCLYNRVPLSRARSGFRDGATVIAWAGGVPLRRAGDSSLYLSEDSRRIHIGVGAITQIDRLEVRWL